MIIEQFTNHETVNLQITTVEIKVHNLITPILSQRSKVMKRVMRDLQSQKLER